LSGLLLDTCTLLWLAGEPDQLSEPAREALDDDERQITLSEASVWEICLKWESEKLTLPAPPRVWIEAQVQAWALDTLPVSRSQMFRSTELPRLHRDPFDRLLVAQALDLGLTLVTPDRHIARYPVAVIW
jgi:PIN domain nuclease of toxin-antitoxin system